MILCVDLGKQPTPLGIYYNMAQSNYVVNFNRAQIKNLWHFTPMMESETF